MLIAFRYNGSLFYEMTGEKTSKAKRKEDWYISAPGKDFKLK
jgi:hypothetical protein